MSEVYKYLNQEDLDKGEALNDNLLFDLLLGAKGTLKVNWKGKNYAYQIKNNSYDKTMDYYNIKPYELLD